MIYFSLPLPDENKIRRSVSNWIDQGAAIYIIKHKLFELLKVVRNVLVEGSYEALSQSILQLLS